METYTDLEVEQILQKALRRRSGENLSRSQVLEIVQELGITPEDFALAEAEWRAETQMNNDRVEFIALMERNFRDHVVTYGVVNLGFMGVNFLITHSITWSVYPLLVWGIFLLLEGWTVMTRDSPQFEKKFEAWHNQRQQARLAKQFKEKLATAATEVTEKVARSAIHLTDKFSDKVAKKIEKWLDDK